MNAPIFKSCRAPAQPDMTALAREGRIRALAAKAERKAAAFQPIETILIDPAFRARLAAIQVQRGIPQVCHPPLAAG